MNSHKNAKLTVRSREEMIRRMGFAKDEMTGLGFRSMASTLLNEQGYNRDWIERQLRVFHGKFLSRREFFGFYIAGLG